MSCQFHSGLVSVTRQHAPKGLLSAPSGGLPEEIGRLTRVVYSGINTDRLESVPGRPRNGQALDRARALPDLPAGSARANTLECRYDDEPPGPRQGGGGHQLVKKTRIGRSPKPGPRTKSTFVLRDELLHRLKRHAAKAGTDTSSLLSRLVEEYLAA